MTAEPPRKLLASLQEIFSDLTERNSLSLKEGTRFEEIPGFDSLLHIALLASVEKEFHIRVKLADFLGLATIGELIESIECKRRSHDHPDP